MGCSGVASVDSTEGSITGQVTLFGRRVPASTAEADDKAVELGVRFTSSSDGQIRGVRFYKGAGNTGVHVGHLWSSSGRQLASVTFQNETSSGWQRALLAAPVPLTKGTQYIVSYFAPSGHYAADVGYFATTGHTSGPLYAPRDGEGGGNGLYAYGASGGFPSSTWQSTSYGVDVIVVPVANLDAGTPPPADGGTPPPLTDGGTPPPPPPPPPDAGTPSATKNCAPSPHLCGFPDGTNTGVPAGVVLRKVPSQLDSGPGWHWDYTYGFIRADQAGAVLDGLDVVGEVSVMAANVTVKNCRIVNIGDSSFGITVRPGADNAVIQDSTIRGADAAAGRVCAGVKVWGVNSLLVQRLDISAASTGIQTDIGTVQDNYVHDMGFKAGDHVNGFTSNSGGAGLLVRHNTFLNSFGQTDAISLFEDFGEQKNATVDDNLMAGGGYSLYAGANPGGAATSQIRITRNRFSRLYYSTGGSYGPYTAFDPAGSGNVWDGNVWDDSGEPVP